AVSDERLGGNSAAPSWRAAGAARRGARAWLPLRRMSSVRPRRLATRDFARAAQRIALFTCRSGLPKRVLDQRGVSTGQSALRGSHRFPDRSAVGHRWSGSRRGAVSAAPPSTDPSDSLGRGLPSLGLLIPTCDESDGER